MSVTSAPLDEGVSLSGVQPKVGAIRQGNRYVGRTKDRDTHVIVKLPVVGQPLLPEVEHLSLRLARAAGVNACEAYLEPLEKLAIDHGYDLGHADAKTQVLVVPRFDRTPKGRIHCEDFAQVLGVMPEDKYGALQVGQRTTSYMDVAGVMMAFESLGEASVHELLRRLIVNELLGNPDMHVKNIGLLYVDGHTPALSPAYDVVAYAAYNKNHGHALALMPLEQAPRNRPAAVGSTGRKQGLSPAMVRAFCSELGLAEKPASTVVREVVIKALATWPDLVASSNITRVQKDRLLKHFNGHSMVESLTHRNRKQQS
jgi:serine/threonine-protein kinase HipA